jgi:hypothetical protein
MGALAKSRRPRAGSSPLAISHWRILPPEWLEPAEPTLRFRAKRDLCAMPSSRAKHYLRQADSCFRFATLAADDNISQRLIRLAQHYQAKADNPTAAVTRKKVASRADRAASPRPVK